jgi:hypothetical protein
VYRGQYNPAWQGTDGLKIYWLDGRKAEGKLEKLKQIARESIPEEGFFSFILLNNVIRAKQAATTSIDVVMDLFTSKPICESYVLQKEMFLERILLDRHQITLCNLSMASIFEL